MVLDDDCIISGEPCYYGVEWLDGGILVWDDMTLQKDIAGTTYTFGIAASSFSSTEFQAEIFLVQGQNDILLASTSFTASSLEAVQFVSTVEGIDPAVNRGEDKLEVRISHVSGDMGWIFYGLPEWAEAGGSYVEIEFEE